MIGVWVAILSNSLIAIIVFFFFPLLCWSGEARDAMQGGRASPPSLSAGLYGDNLGQNVPCFDELTARFRTFTRVCTPPKKVHETDVEGGERFIRRLLLSGEEKIT